MCRLLPHAVLFLLPGSPWALHDEWDFTTAAEGNPYDYLASLVHGW